jgi:D-alanyl-D-alanine carboxypeptidase/D-alanyl-D-alanine-endopeptidase (penicillin-binding protein 4)
LVLATPVLSVRRLPQWLASTVAGESLQTSLDTVMANRALGGATTSSCLLVRRSGAGGSDLASGSDVPVLFDLRGTDELSPASNIKLLTATAVLDKLGPTARLSTAVAAGKAPAGGVVAGNLYLVGGGDPLLRTPGFAAGITDGRGIYTSLPQLAADVRAAGVTHVTGGVIGDESRYDGARYVASWKPIYRAEGDVGPLSALDVNDGLLDGTHGVTKGASPPVQAAQLFTTLLKAAGVKVDGPAAAGKTAPGAVTITSVQSAPMSEVVGEVLDESDDTGAELLTKELGLRFDGGGTTAAGVAVIRADMAADGLPVDQLHLVDGSGLDTSDRATCQLLVATLDRAGPTSTLAGDLPVAARSGTLDYRLAGTPAAGRVRAKTGTLDGVAALSGFVLPAAGQGAPNPALAGPLTFSLLLNNIPSFAEGISAGNGIAVALARYPNVPTLAVLGPLPAQSR